MTRQCRRCGCTDEWGCPRGCHWVEYDLCSECVTRPRDFWFAAAVAFAVGLSLWGLILWTVGWSP